MRCWAKNAGRIASHAFSAFSCRCGTGTQRMALRPENPLERHPREGGDVKLHHLYYLKACDSLWDGYSTHKIDTRPMLNVGLWICILLSKRLIIQIQVTTFYIFIYHTYVPYIICHIYIYHISYICIYMSYTYIYIYISYYRNII